MSVSPGLTAEEIRQLVHEYHVLARGQKGPWLAARGVSHDRMRRWSMTVFQGDLDRGLIPRDGGMVTVPPRARTAFEKSRAGERAAHAAEVARLTARIRELEGTNDALGKAIGLLHALSELEPDASPATPGPHGSSTPRTTSSGS